MKALDDNMKLITALRPSDDIIAGRQAMRLGEIWIVPESILHLDSLIRPDFFAFEWGGGGSTIWLARRCAHLVTIEQSLRWYIWVTRRLTQEGLNADVYHSPIFPGSKNEDYIHPILAFPDNTFNLISPDGYLEIRRECIKEAAPKLKPGGIMLLDNSNWFEFGDLLPGWEEVRYQTTEFEWLGDTSSWATSILIKPSDASTV